MLSKIIKELVCMVIIVSISTIFGVWMLYEWRKEHPESEKQVNACQGKWGKNKYKIIKNEFNSYDILLLNGQLCRGYYPTISSAQKQIDFLINQYLTWRE